LEFSTAKGKSEELVLDTFVSILEPLNIPVFGGNAGVEDGKETLVSLNGKVYENACVFLILRNLRGKIFLYKENIYRPTNHFFIATDVNIDDHIVYELDKKPAAEVIAQTLGIKKKSCRSILFIILWGVSKTVRFILPIMTKSSTKEVSAFM
jgi:hypothetical protein